MGVDKIFNNKYKTGEIELKEFGDMKLDSNLMSSFGVKDIEPDTLIIYKELENILYNIYVNSPFYERFKNLREKIKKEETISIFFYFNDRIPHPEKYTSLDKFISIAEFLPMDYKILYRGLGVNYKTKLIQDLEKKYTSVRRDKTKKLF